MRRRRLLVLLLSTVLAATVLAAAPPAAAGGGCHRPATEGRGTTLALNELCFSPTVLRVAPGEGERLAELVRREMQGVYQLRVPLVVSMATGRSWAEAQH